MSWASSIENVIMWTVRRHRCASIASLPVGQRFDIVSSISFWLNMDRGGFMSQYVRMDGCLRNLELEKYPLVGYDGSREVGSSRREKANVIPTLGMASKSISRTR